MSRRLNAAYSSRRSTPPGGRSSCGLTPPPGVQCAERIRATGRRAMTCGGRNGIRARLLRGERVSPRPRRLVTHAQRPEHLGRRSPVAKQREGAEESSEQRPHAPARHAGARCARQPLVGRCSGKPLLVEQNHHFQVEIRAHPLSFLGCPFQLLRREPLILRTEGSESRLQPLGQAGRAILVAHCIKDVAPATPHVDEWPRCHTAPDRYVDGVH